ncbi:MAG: hypothetical protein Q8938_02450, partial [Bacteroidota bacterium]|nr:hypothetical protein [Bacteroidota bacterium]
MMKDMKILLAELDSILREKNPENYKKLQDPLPEKEVSERMKALGVEDQAFKDLFLWKNGVDISGGIDATDEL